MIKNLSLKSPILETDCHKIPGAWECIIASNVNDWKNPLAVVVSKKNIERFVRNLEFFCDNVEILEIPSLGTLPYDRQSPSHRVIAQRIHVFNKISVQKKQIIVSHPKQLYCEKYPKQNMLFVNFRSDPRAIGPLTTSL